VSREAEGARKIKKIFGGAAYLEKLRDEWERVDLGSIAQVPLPRPRRRAVGLLGLGRRMILLPATTAANWSPGLNPKLLRISLEITICDF
jgi:hypothetical protein